MKKTLSLLLSLIMIATTLFAVPFTAKAAIPFESARELTLDKNYFVKITSYIFNENKENVTIRGHE